MQHDRLIPGSRVVLKKLLPGLLDDLPSEDQRAIRDIVGKPILLLDYDDLGRAELQFTDNDGVIHSIFVPAEFIRES